MKKTRQQDENITNEDDNFLTRWSRRKQESRQPGSMIDELTAEPSEKTTEKSITPRDYTDEDMPALESLTEESDYSCFLSPKVSETLRKKALRILFSSPGLNVCDGLDDYDEDYTSFEKMGDIITADIRHQMDRLAAKPSELSAESTPVEPVQDTCALPVEHETVAQEVSDSDSDTTPSLEPDSTEKS